jgi:acyl carrier protein
LRLVAWVVNQPDQQVNIEELRAHIKASLPDYMVPAAFVLLPRLPLNSNGKVDRMALPSPEESESAKRAYVAPVGPVEEGAAAIWADVLRLDRIGAEDDFFEIGGHSLLATRIVSRLREHFQVSVTVRMVFERPTIRQLALAIEAARLEAADDEDEEIVALGPTRVGSKQDTWG